jgi:hypothetical protein
MKRRLFGGKSKGCAGNSGMDGHIHGHGHGHNTPVTFMPAFGRGGHGEQHVPHARYLGPMFPASGSEPSPYGPGPGPGPNPAPAPTPTPLPGPATDGCVIYVNGPLVSVGGRDDIDYASAQLGLSRSMATRASASCGLASGAPTSNMYY